MEIKVRQLKLRNFKGIKSFTLDLDGDNATIYGRNGVGKSTLADALSWLLFDKDASGNSKFSVKRLDNTGLEIHNLEHEVEAVLIVDGSGQSIKKTLTEKWTKKRGSSTPEFSGHVTSYEVNGVPKKKGEYTSFVDHLVREDLFRLLTSTTHFNAMKWQDRRQLLLEVSGSLTDKEVLDRIGLDRAKELLDGRSYEDAVAVLKSQRSKVSKALDGIQPRLDEVDRSSQAEAPVPPKTKLSLPELQEALKTAQNERAALLAGDTSADRERILQIRTEIAKQDDLYAERMREYLAEESEYKRSVEACDVDIRQITYQIETLMPHISLLEQEIDEEREKWHTWNDTQAPKAVCETCGQPLPEDQADRIRAEFRLKKAEALKRIKEEGQQKAQELVSSKQNLDGLNSELAEKEDERKLAVECIENLERPTPPDHAKAIRKIADIETGMAQAKPDTAKTDEWIEQLEGFISQASELQAWQKQQKSNAERRVELEAEQKTLGQELDRIDADLMKLEDFLRAKVGMIEGIVSDKFAPLSFKLFEDQINGGLRETCETLVPSPDGNLVPWSDANTGHKILAGLRIIEVLSKHYDVTAPVFVDNAESLTETVPEIGSQIIRLVASDCHDELTVEMEHA